MFANMDSDSLVFSPTLLFEILNTLDVAELGISCELVSQNGIAFCLKTSRSSLLDPFRNSLNQNTTVTSAIETE